MSDNEELDDSWISDIEKEEEIYGHFYREITDEIELYYIYVNSSNKIYYIKKEKCKLDKSSILQREKLINLLKKNEKYNNKKHKLISILQYNIDLSAEEIFDYLNDSEKFNFLSTKSNIEEIKWRDSIRLFKDINSLHIIFYEDKKNTKVNTKKIYIKNDKKRRRKSRKKSI
tara:strand:+ start:2357 stop:2872 length:516 start_codon:yes stop_codon:yes gene_type:complete